MARRNLDQVRIAAPCPASWASMEGDEKVRYCGLCKLNVYNISEMSRREAEAFLAKSEGRTCIRMYQRADGKVLTRNCPVGLSLIYRRMILSGTAAVVMVFGVFSTAMARVRGEDPARVSDLEDVKDRARAWPILGPLVDKISPMDDDHILVIGGAMAPMTPPKPVPTSGP